MDLIWRVKIRLVSTVLVLTSFFSPLPFPFLFLFLFNPGVLVFAFGSIDDVQGDGKRAEDEKGDDEDQEQEEKEGQVRVRVRVTEKQSKVLCLPSTTPGWGSWYRSFLFFRRLLALSTGPLPSKRWDDDSNLIFRRWCWLNGWMPGSALKGDHTPEMER